MYKYKLTLNIHERIARAVLVALRENQSIPLQDVPPLSKDPLPKFPPPRESHVATPLVSRLGEYRRVQHLLQGDMLMEKFIFYMI